MAGQIAFGARLSGNVCGVGEWRKRETAGQLMVARAELSTTVDYST